MAKVIDAPAAQVRAGEIATQVLSELADRANPGVSGHTLDTEAERIIRGAGGVPAFKGYRGFPSSICLSINNQVVHGVPGAQVLKEGDLASLDIGVKVDGYYVDAARTVTVGKVDSETERLRDATERALEVAFRYARAGRATGDLGAAVEEFVKGQGYAVVRDCVGHGIGKELHEDPSIPNFGQRGKGPNLKSGQTVAIEPMVVMGSPELRLAEDKWTLSTADGRPAAHAEETVLITPGAPIRLTPVTPGLHAWTTEKADDKVTGATDTSPNGASR